MKITTDSLREHAIHLGVPKEAIDQAAASGIPIGTLWQLIMTYGLPIIAMLAQMFGWKLPPMPVPTPPPLPPITAKP